MTSNDRTKDASYEVALRGELGPALLAWLSSLGVGHAVTSSVFLVPVHAGQGLCEVAAMLQARGLQILDIRQVSVSPKTP